MDAMFYDCRSLTSIDLTMFDTRNVTNMRYLFGGCKNLEKLDLSKFNTQKLENASYMFYGCKKLTSLDISGFDTGNVTTMREMFQACTVLEEIDISGFQTGKVTDMAFMFAECVNISSLNLDSFDVQNVNDFSNMFDNCRKLKKLNLSGFDMGGATSDKSVMSLVEQCGELDELWTPRNIKVSISLGGTWYDDQGNACTEFPKNISTSVHLRKHKAAEQPDNEESSSAEESSDTAESSEESSSNEESATTEESSDAEESVSSEEASSGEENPTVEESPETEENSTNEESSSTEESSSNEESSSTEESSSNEEHETAEEKTSQEENEGSGESSSETERSPYTDKERIVKTFEITARSKADTSLTISKIPAKTYNGKYQKPSVTVKCGKKKLVKNKDYIVSYQQNLHATANNQKAQVTVTGIGNYEGIVETAEFDIKPQKIAKAAVKGTKDSLTLTYGGTRLKEGVHYTVTYDASGAKAGSKKIKIKLEGLGDFAGSEVTKSVKAR